MAKKQNAYLARQEEKKKAELTVMTLWAHQQCFDALTLVLSDPEVMGKDTFGPKRLSKLNVAINDKLNEIMVGMTKRTEASHVRRVTDDQLRKIWGDEFLPWEERYEHWDDRGI